MPVMLWGLLTVLSATAPAPDAEAEPPTVPVGLDAYRMWDRWALQRIGVRAGMRSTYDRSGNNEAADASHFLYQPAGDFNVTLDVLGPGVLYFTRANHWHGSPWHYEVDGIDHIIRESSTADPDHPVENSVFIPQDVLPSPLTWTWSVTRGADLMWVPIPFERSLRLAYSRTHYGTGYYIWHQFVRGIPLSAPIRAWDGRTPPDPDVLELLGRAGRDLLPPEGSRAARAMGLTDLAGTAAVPASGPVTLAELAHAPAVLRAIEFSVPAARATAFGRCRLRITWDDRAEASVDAPLALFFAAGTFHNRDGREYLVRGFPIHVRFADGRMHAACFYPMPFFRSARVELVGVGREPVPDVRWRLRRAPYEGPTWHAAFFHATCVDHPRPVRGHDLVLLDTRRTEGGGDWSGHLAGMSWIFSHEAVLNTLEGDPRFFFDDSRTPQCYGTGTEEWGGGGDYWGGRNMTLPLAGHPAGVARPEDARCPEDRIESAYRFLLADLMPFGRHALVRLEHGGTNESTEHYETVVYWYGAPAPSLVRTDELDVGDPDSERNHDYVSPEASGPVRITSRFEWGPDTIAGEEIFPAHTEDGRFTRGESRFTMRLRPDNLGVLLRRTLDYAFPNQRAEVFVADAPAAGEPPDEAFRHAGTWYLAGSNTCVYSNPPDELGPAEHHVQTSNRRFRDDEFLVPRDLTAGRQAVRIRVRFTPVAIPLFPGHPVPDLAWSELRYTADCFVRPRTPAD